MLAPADKTNKATYGIANKPLVAQCAEIGCCDGKLSNGNVLITNGPAGTFTEVNASGTTVWKYINPVKPSGIISQGTAPSQNLVFKANFYPINYSGFASQTLTAGTIIENSNTVSSSCSITLSNNENTFENNVKFYPNPANNQLNLEFKNTTISEDLTVKISNSLGQIVYQKSFKNEENIIINISNFAEGLYYLNTENGFYSNQNKIIIKH